MLLALRKETEECTPTFYCTECGSGIYIDDYYYEFENAVVCEECMEACKKTCCHTAEEMECGI